MKKDINHKRDVLLLMAHGMALAVNISKVIITNNPFAVNIFMVLRTCKLVWNVLRDEMMLTNKVIEK